MSKNLNVKASKRERPRSSDKLKNKKNQGGTPEKSATPSHEDEQPTPTAKVIWDEELEKLQIKEDDLKNLHAPGEKPKSPVVSKVTVRKIKPASEWNKPKPKTVTVARAAPPDAPIKQPDYSGFSGPKYNLEGHVIPHSLLGNYEDFRNEALKRGDLLDLPAPCDEDKQPAAPTLKYEKKKRVRPAGKHADESKALHNWQMKMIERKRQQGYISKLLQKDPEDLTMNQSENYHKTQEERYIIDRTIPFMDYGKGYRVGSEFWKQQERFGDDIGGIHMTLTQTEKGYPPPVEHVGTSKSILAEKGWDWQPNHTRPIHYPWDKAPYLETRKKQLQGLIEELDPHQPEFESLEVIGTANPKRNAREPTEVDILHLDDNEQFMPEHDEYEEDAGLTPQRDREESSSPVFGPSINFAGQPARWTGDSTTFVGQVGIEARVTFESYATDRVTSYLYIINDGTTAVYYDWKKLPKDNPFDLVHSNVQRFYFNNSSGVILPGETMKFPFVFKSPNAGVFTEQWNFETRPTLCGGASLIVTLRGIALQEDKYLKQREELESELQHKQAEQIARQILNELISGMKVPDRPSSPLDAYLTEEEIFARNNPTLKYNHQLVQELKQLYVELFDEEDREGKIWDLCVEDLKDEILQLNEDDERKENFLHQMNAAVTKMSFIPNKPVNKNLYKVGYQLLLEAVDNIVGQSALIRNIMGLPERDNDDLPDDFSDARSKSKAEKAKPVPDKKAPPPKDTKGGKGQAAAKPDPKSKTPAPPKPPKSRGPSATPAGEMTKERTKTPTSGHGSPYPTDTDPVTEKKYRDKFYSQAYLVMNDTLAKMDRVFNEIVLNEDRPPLML